jgi:hypothetical protein
MLPYLSVRRYNCPKQQISPFSISIGSHHPWDGAKKTTSSASQSTNGLQKRYLVGRTTMTRTNVAFVRHYFAVNTHDLLSNIIERCVMVFEWRWIEIELKESTQEASVITLKVGTELSQPINIRIGSHASAIISTSGLQVHRSSLSKNSNHFNFHQLRLSVMRSNSVRFYSSIVIWTSLTFVLIVWQAEGRYLATFGWLWFVCTQINIPSASSRMGENCVQGQLEYEDVLQPSFRGCNENMRLLWCGRWTSISKANCFQIEASVCGEALRRLYTGNQMVCSLQSMMW